MRSSARFAASILIATAVVGTVRLAVAQAPIKPKPTAQPAAKLEQVFADPKYQLTSVAVSAKGRLFTNYPVWSPAHRYRVVEVVAGQARPYPDEPMNRWKPGDDGTKKWVSVQAVYVDDQDKLCVVDPAAPGFGEVRVEDLGHFLVTDGMEFDKHGNLYFGDLEHNAIVKIAPDLKTRAELVKDDRLIWPDSYAISRDGYLYLSTSQVQMAPPFNGGVDKRTLPYGLFRLKIE